MIALNHHRFDWSRIIEAKGPSEWLPSCISPVSVLPRRYERRKAKEYGIVVHASDFTRAISRGDACHRAIKVSAKLRRNRKGVGREKKIAVRVEVAK